MMSVYYFICNIYLFNLGYIYVTSLIVQTNLFSLNNLKMGFFCGHDTLDIIYNQDMQEVPGASPWLTTCRSVSKVYCWHELLENDNIIVDFSKGVLYLRPAQPGNFIIFTAEYPRSPSLCHQVYACSNDTWL